MNLLDRFKGFAYFNSSSGKPRCFRGGCHVPPQNRDFSVPVCVFSGAGAGAGDGDRAGQRDRNRCQRRRGGNAQVSITETDKSATRTTTTDAGGLYVFAELPVGPYRLEVKAPGFKDYVQSGIVLVVNNNIRINVAMQVGAVNEKVEVSAETSQVETKETSVAAVIDQ